MVNDSVANSNVARATLKYITPLFLKSVLSIFGRVQNEVVNADVSTRANWTTLAVRSSVPPTYTGRIVVEAQRKEALALQEKNRRNGGLQSEAIETNDCNLLISECRKEDSNLHPLARTRT